jgi:hypothetical protein
VFFQAKRNTHVLKIEIIVLTLLVLLNIFNGHVMAFHSASGVTMQMSVVALIGEKTVSAAVSFLFTVAVAVAACLWPGAGPTVRVLFNRGHIKW